MPLFAAIAGAAVCCIHAQDNTAAPNGPADEPIIFSQPGNAATAAPQSPDAARAPSATTPIAPQFFNSHLPEPSLQQNIQPQQTAPQDKNIWTLMTPAEILGVEPPEKAMRSEQQKAYDEDREGRTPLERFMKRQADAQAVAATNGTGGQTFTEQWDFSRAENKSQLPGESSLSGREKSAADFLNNSLNEWSAHPQKNGGRNQFTPPKSMEKTANARQMMTVQQFSQLLAPFQSQDAAPKGSAMPALEKINSDKESIVDPNLQPQPLFNPVGNSYKPIQSNISKPVGIQPLPTLTSPVVPSVAAPAWAPKPPPWHSQAPQPFAIPQRQF
ncbi:MAG TPA: hypothetical protein VFV23_07005 [Verrucomicrobiae bacterium]|nr:hypothetical protein [Verrucomicrobiae bacterium]